MGCSNSTSGWKKKHPFFVEFSSTSRDEIGLLKILVVFSMFPRIGVLGIPSRKLTYPTWGKGKSSSNMPYQGDMLVSWRVCLRGPNTFSRGIWMSSKPSNFLCRIPLKFMTPSSGLGGTNLTSLNLRLGTVSFWEKFVPQGKTTHGKNKTLEKWSPKKKKTSYIAILSIIWSCYSWWVKWVDGQQNALHGTPCIKEFDKELIGFIGFSFLMLYCFLVSIPTLSLICSLGKITTNSSLLITISTTQK